MALDRNDIAALTTAFENALKNRGVGRSSGGGWGSSGGSSNTSTTDTISSGVSLDSLKNTAASAAGGISLLAESAKGSLNTWRELSRNGATFSNDLLGMSLAAANSRVSLDEFSDVIIRNGKQMAGLGGSVTAGAEAFAKFSQGLFDSKMDTQMRNLAYTTKEMNEVMAIHMGNVRSSAQLDEEGRKREYEAANKLAVEMDSTSKLMGKSREIQMEEMRARQVDMQVQAKIRMEANKMRAEGKSEAEISTYKASVAAALKKATDEGVGQAAKEIFATGTVTSQTGATQAALAQRQVGAVKEQFGAIRRGDTKSAEAAAARATSEAIKLQNNEQIQSLMTLGAAAGPDIEASLKGMFDATQTMVDSLESIARERSLDLKTEAGRAEAIRIAQERAIAKPDTAKTGVLGGALATEKVQQELKAGAAGAITAINASGESIAGALNNVGRTISETLNAIEGPGKSLGAKMSEAAQKGLKPEPITRKEGEGELAFKERQEQASGGPLGTAMVAAVKASNIAVNEFNEGISTLVQQFKDTRSSPVTIQTDKAIPVTIESDKTTQKTEKPPTVEIKEGRSTGSVGTVGKLIEDFGQGTLAMLHGKEGVITEDQLKNLALGIQSEGAAAAVGSLKSAVPKLDLGGVSKDIKTTFSSVKVATSGGDEKTTREVMSDKAKAAESELEKLTDAFGEQRRKVAEQVNAQLKSEGKESLPFKEKNKIVADQIKEARAQYEEEAAKLRKVIEDGTTTEVTYKKAAVEESKKVSAEERIAKFNDLQAASEQIKENSKLTQQSIKEKKTASQEMSKAQEAELKEAQKQAALSKDLIGKNVAGMGDDAISDMIKKSGAKFENFYIDTTKAGESILKSFSADYVEANKRSKGPSVGDALKESTAGIPKSIVNAEEQAKIKQATADPAVIERSMQLGKINLNDSQKKIYDEMMSMSSSAAKQRLEALKAESEAAFNTNRAAADAMQTMEKSYEQEGRLAELEHNEEYKRLSEQLSASSNLSKVKNSELTAAKQAADTQATIAKITGKNTEDLKNTQIEAAKEVQKNADLTNTALLNAVPTKELTSSTEELTAKLTQGQKNYFNYLLKQDDETIKYKEESTKQQLTLDIEKLKEADDKIESVKAEIQNASTANQKKQLEFKLEGYKQEKTALEESKKYHEEDLETINKAIEAKKKDIDATTQVVEATSEKIEQAKLDVQAVTDVNNKTKQETAVTAKESPANKNRILDSEKLRTTAVNKEGKVDLNSLRLPGMKGFGSELKAIPKEPPAAAADTKGALNKVAEDKAKVEKEKEAARAAEAAKVKTTSTATVTPTTENAAAPKKSATLDDVVGSLNRLNTQMSQLITQQSDLLNKQIKTTRTSGSSNIYDRVTP